MINLPCEQVDLHSVTHDAEAERSIIHADTSADATWGDYANTHIMIFTWNAEGTKITHVEDMMDSAGLQARMAVMQAWVEKQNKAWSGISIVVAELEGRSECHSVERERESCIPCIVRWVHKCCFSK